MDLLSRLAEKLPVKDPESVNNLRLSLAHQSGDPLALAHVRLHNIYRQEAAHKPLLAGAYGHLARYHLDEALVCAKFWPEPWGILGGLQMMEGDLWKGLETLSNFIEKERLFIQVVLGDDERLRFCRRLAQAASLRCQLGQFAHARQWFTEALEQFRQIATKWQIEETDLEDAILLGISGCLLLEFRYEDAKKFVDGILADQIFSSYQSPARRNLAISGQLLPGLVDATQDFAGFPESEDLWAELMEDVQRCDSPEKARETRRKILDAIKTHDANRHIQALAASVKIAMTRQMTLILSVEPAAEQDEVPAMPRIDLSQLNPEVRQWALELTESTGPVLTQMYEQIKQLNQFSRALRDAMRRLVEDNVKRTQDIAESVFRLPVRYRVAWAWWSSFRLIIRIVIIAYVLGKLFEDFLEKKGTSLLKRLELPHGELMLLVAILLVGLAIDHFAGKILDAWNLSKYKHLLTRIVYDRSDRLWRVYNALRRILLDTNQSLTEVEKRMRIFSGTGLD